MPTVYPGEPTAWPSGLPTPSPSPECTGDDYLYKIQLTDSASDGWEGATYRVVDSDGIEVSTGTLSVGGTDTQYLCLPDGTYDLEFTSFTYDDAGGAEASCADVIGSGGGSHSGCVNDADDDGFDTSFTAVGGVVHDDAPTPVPTPSPSPECTGDDHLYKIHLTDSASDGWEGADYFLYDADGVEVKTGTLSDGGTDTRAVAGADADADGHACRTARTTSSSCRSPMTTRAAATRAAPT